MLNMLVVEDDILQCQQLVNFISSSIPTIKLHTMSFNGKEALDIIKNNLVDIILLDLKLPDISGIEILEYIENNNLKNYRDSIIVISGETNLHTNLFTNSYIYACFQKPTNLNIVVENLEKLIENKKEIHDEQNIKFLISKELEYLGYNFSHIGTQYLHDCIYYLYKNERLNANLSRDIYPIIAKKYSTTTNNIKCNIFQATNNSYCECEENKLLSYFGRYLLSKPTTKNVIYTILHHIEPSKQYYTTKTS